MSTDFTRGPWARSGCTVYALNEKRTRNRFAAQVQDAHSTREELLSVAKMMQAVPDMFEALDKISGMSRALRVGGPDPMDLQGLSDALEEAIGLALDAMAKATA